MQDVRDARIQKIKGKLQEMKDYKRLLAETGMTPDEDDKRRESDLIVQLLRLEKGLAAKSPPKPLRDGRTPNGRRPQRGKGRARTR